MLQGNVENEQREQSTSTLSIRNNEDIIQMEEIVVPREGDVENKQGKWSIGTKKLGMKKKKRRKYYPKRKPENPELRKFKIKSFSNFDNIKIKEYYSWEDKVEEHNYITLELFKLPSIDLEEYKMDSYYDHVVDILKMHLGKNSGIEDRLISLMFDEMPVLPHFQYIPVRGILDGFDQQNYEDAYFGLANMFLEMFTDHSQIFMVRSVYRKWEFPVSYMFSKGIIKTSTKVGYIKEIVRRLTKIGFVVAAIVCDQRRTNCAAMKMLLKETKRIYLEENKRPKENIIRIGRSEIIPIYDIRHLIKGIRNHLLNKNLTFIVNEEKFTASWEDLKTAYFIIAMKDRKALTKITPKHVYPGKIPMLEVSKAVELLSSKVSRSMVIMMERKLSSPNGREITTQSMGTASLCYFMGTLFESFNNDVLKVGDKNVKKYVTMKSTHLLLWREAENVVNTMQFLNGSNEVIKQPSVLRNLLTTIRGYIKLHSFLLKEEKLNCLPTKYLSQEPLENSFCLLRQTYLPNTYKK